MLLIVVWVCSPCFCWIKWQSTLSRQTHTINSLCGRMHRDLWTCVCVSGYTSILIYTHTAYTYIHVCACVHVRARVCVCVLDPWSFPPILSPWNARFSLLLAVVPGKYSYVLGQQPSWCIPPASGKLRAPVHCVYYITCVKIEMKGVHWIKWILR